MLKRQIVHSVQALTASKFMQGIPIRSVNSYRRFTISVRMSLAVSENRARLTCLVLDAVRKRVGPQFPIALRFSADELLPGGNSVQDTLEILDYFVEKVDILNVSAALNDSLQYQIDKMNLADGWRSFGEGSQRALPREGGQTSEIFVTGTSYDNS